jgi:hypothetical protein
MCLQVHKGKSDVTHHIDPTEILVKLNGIEEPDGSMDQDDVLKMRIAMTFTHVAANLPGPEERIQIFFGLKKSTFQVIEDLSFTRLFQEMIQLFQGLCHRRLNARGRCQWALRAQVFAFSMCFGKQLSKVIDVGGGQSAGFQQLVETTVLWKLKHLDSVFDDLPGLAEARVLHRASDLENGFVKAWRETAIQSQFLMAKMPAGLQS